MKIGEKMKKMVNGILIGTMVFSMAGMAFADNISTEEKAPKRRTAIHQKLGERFEKRGPNLEDTITKLVEAGTITQDEATKWKAFNEERMEERKAEMDKVKEMTKEERKAYLEERKDNKEAGPRRDGMATLVEEGIFTQEKAEQVGEKMHEMRALEQEKRFEEKMNKLVEEGMITQDEATKWKAFNKEKMEERKVEMEKVKAMSEEDRKAYFDERKNTRGEKGDRLSELVKAGVISQDTADKIKKNAPQRPERLDAKKRPMNGVRKFNKIAK
jgi:gas vesicle protein